MSWGRKASYRSYRAQCSRRAARNARQRTRRAQREAARADLPRQSARWPLYAGLIALILVILAISARADTPDQATRWRTAKLLPARSIEADKAVVLYQRTSPRYQAVSASGVPAVVVFCLHYREASNAFTASLAQGDPLTHRSRNIPAGRIPGVPPPYTWEACALDALTLDKMGAKDWRSVDGAFNAVEGYNGWGVWLYHRGETPSGYLTAGTSLYKRGKYSADGRWDRFAVDKQLGIMAIMLRMRERGIALPF